MWCGVIFSIGILVHSSPHITQDKVAFLLVIVDPGVFFSLFIDFLITISLNTVCSSQQSTSMSTALRSRLITSVVATSSCFLKPVTSCPEWTTFGTRLSSIRRTWPNQRRRRCVSFVKVLGTPFWASILILIAKWFSRSFLSCFA